MARLEDAEGPARCRVPDTHQPDSYPAMGTLAIVSQFSKPTTVRLSGIGRVFIAAPSSVRLVVRASNPALAPRPSSRYTPRQSDCYDDRVPAATDCEVCCRNTEEYVRRPAPAGFMNPAGRLERGIHLLAASVCLSMEGLQDDDAPGDPPLFHRRVRLRCCPATSQRSAELWSMSRLEKPSTRWARDRALRPIWRHGCTSRNRCWPPGSGSCSSTHSFAPVARPQGLACASNRVFVCGSVRASGNSPSSCSAGNSSRCVSVLVDDGMKALGCSWTVTAAKSRQHSHLRHMNALLTNASAKRAYCHS